MKIQCVICQDLLEPGADVFITPCGHVFHFPCLVQWLEKSESCPQCRQKVRKRQIHRVYFTLCNTDSVVEDSFSLQQRVDSLNFKIKLKETEITKIRVENEDLKKQNSGLRREVKKVESEINEKKSTIHAVKEQVIYFKQLCQETEGLKSELSAMKNRLERYQNIQTLINGTVQDVEEMVQRTRDPANLFTYLSLMKREMSTSVDKRKELRATVKRLQQELHTVSMERNFLSEEHAKRKQLDEELAICRSENQELKQRLSEYETNNGAHENQSRYSIPRQEKYSRSHENEEGPSPKKLKHDHPISENSDFNSPLNFNSSSSSDVVFVNPSEPRTVKENEENSPVPRLKTRGIFALKEQAAQRQTHASSNLRLRHFTSKTSSSHPRTSSVRKNWQENRLRLTFDGFGGHCRSELIMPDDDLRLKRPMPVDNLKLKRPMPVDNLKLKRPMPDNRGPKKAKFDVGNNKNMNDYIINLT